MGKRGIGVEKAGGGKSVGGGKREGIAAERKEVSTKGTGWVYESVGGLKDCCSWEPPCVSYRVDDISLQFVLLCSSA